MATLYIDEYNLDLPARSTSIVPVYPPTIRSQKVTISGSSQQSAAVNSKTRFVTIKPVGGAVYIKIGANPTANDSDKHLMDGEPYDVEVGRGNKIAVIDAE